MRSYLPGDAWGRMFPLYDPQTGESADADALPVAAVWRDGAFDAAVTVLVERLAMGLYNASAGIPGSYARGDRFEVVVTATVMGVTASDVIESIRLAPVASNVSMKVTELRDGSRGT